MESGDSGVGSTEWESWSEVGVCVWGGVSQKWRCKVGVGVGSGCWGLELGVGVGSWSWEWELGVGVGSGRWERLGREAQKLVLGVGTPKKLDHSHPPNTPHSD